MTENTKDIIIMPLNSGNFNTDSLQDFDRGQEVTQVYRLSGGELRLVPLSFTETWSGERKKEKAAEILSEKYITYGAFDGDRVIGEIMLIKELNRGRMIVDSLHVSRGYRRRGIGRMLMNEARKEALRRGAKALYISCCSAKETIDYYMAMGCRLSDDPIPAYAEEEPCDLQMELALPHSR